jgi:uncharacterized protein
MKPVILDTGPLVAWFCPRDEYHAWARQVIGQLQPGAIICEAVLTEVTHLTAKDGIAPSKVIEFVERGRLAVVSLVGDLPVIRELLERYADAPMDFADACIVRLAELHQTASVCTLDGQFRFFRKNGQEPISLVAPFATSP